MIAEQADRCQQALEALAEIGMDLAQTLRRDVVAGAAVTADPEPDADPEPVETAAARASRMRALRWGDPALAFSRLSRSIRLTFAMEARVVRGDDVGALPSHRTAAMPDDEPPVDWAPTFEEVAVVKLGAYKKVARRVVGDAIEAEAREPAEGERLREALEAWIEDDSDDEALMALPIGDFINRVRRDLGMAPLDEPWTETERSKFRPMMAEHRARMAAGAFRVGSPYPKPGPAALAGLARGEWRSPIPRSAYAGTSTGSPPGPGP